MLVKKYLSIYLFITFFLSAGVENLTLNEAMKKLHTNNLELKISRFHEEMKAYDTIASKGHNYGKLDMTIAGLRSNDAGNVFGFKLQSREATFGDFGFSEFNSVNPNILDVQPESLNYPEVRNHYQTKLSYMLPLYTGGKLTEYVRISDAMQRMSQYDTQKLLNEKIFQTKKAFYDISLVENYIMNLSKIIKNIDHLRTIVKSMKKEGYAQEIDMLEVDSRKSEALSMFNQAKLNKDLAYQFLTFLLDEEISSIVKVNDMADMPKFNMENVEVNNIDIQKALLGLEVTKMAIKIEESNYLPTVGAFGEYGSSDNELWNEFLDKDAYTVGVQLTWNIFNGGVDNANLEKAKVNYMKVEHQVSLAKSGIALQVKKLETEILSKNADVENFQKQLKYAEKVYKNYQTRYEEGIVSISDVLIKQSKQLEVLLQLLTLKNERNTKIFELNSLLNQG